VVRHCNCNLPPRHAWRIISRRVKARVPEKNDLAGRGRHARRARDRPVSA
jgi:hypothetical protein